jgi:hypothetical protein
MSVNGKSIKKFSAGNGRDAQARYTATTDQLRRKAYFLDCSGGGRVEPEIAKRIIAHPQVIGGKDALFPGHHQTWRMRPGDDAAYRNCARLMRRMKV